MKKMWFLILALTGCVSRDVYKRDLETQRYDLVRKYEAMEINYNSCISRSVDTTKK